MGWSGVLIFFRSPCQPGRCLDFFSQARGWLGTRLDFFSVSMGWAGRTLGLRHFDRPGQWKTRTVKKWGPEMEPLWGGQNGENTSLIPKEPNVVIFNF